MSQLDWDDKGSNIDGKKLSNLRFAGDIVLICQRQEDLRQMVKELNEFGRVIGLTINRTKTMVMRNEWADASPIVLESSTLHEKLLRLPRVISMGNNLRAEIMGRKKCARCEFGKRVDDVLEGFGRYEEQKCMAALSKDVDKVYVQLKKQTPEAVCKAYKICK
ncbi:surfactant protein B [Teladorsagia circumcincta]|uniref:Surfactant protein B n=1 Tax=Teladorsagia circumcincta TaxID=45464 RepID=A0A2G9TVC3_TELCI|nr:surfactant protein B [Teladorsagia circumcincta]